MTSDSPNYVADVFDGSEVEGMPDDAAILCISESGVSGAYVASTVSVADYFDS